MFSNNDIDIEAINRNIVKQVYNVIQSSECTASGHSINVHLTSAYS